MMARLKFKIESLFYADDVACDHSQHQLDSNIQAIIEGCKQNGSIDVEALTKELFPVKKDAIFISHQKENKNYAKHLKDDLKKALPNYTVFVDSDVWANVYMVLEYIQTKYAEKLDYNIYSLRDCNRISASIYLVLSRALQEMVLNCYAFICVIPQGSTGEIIKSESPWFIDEIITSGLIKEGVMQDHTLPRMQNFSQLKFIHEVDISRLTKVNSEQLLRELQLKSLS